MANSRVWIFIGAISGCISVITGAFGAHALRSKLESRAMEVYQTASHYQIIHALALIAVGVWATQLSQSSASGTVPMSINFAGYAFSVGTILFSGSLYALALTDIKILGAITPLGGLAFILGWAAFAMSAWKTNQI